jgi:hypothetical protein
MNRWIAIVIALLVGNAAAMGVLLANSGDPSDRIVSDYYQKAVDWDRAVAALEASADLGWSVAPRLVAAAPGTARVEIEVVGGTGAPIAGAWLEVTVRHNSRADGVAAVLLEAEPGRYRGDVAVATTGLHVVDYLLRRGGDHFVGSMTVELEAP